MGKRALLRNLLRAADRMVQGGLSETTRQCGKPTCACAQDPQQRHGPHLYVTYRSEGKNRALYVPAEHGEKARQAHAAWAEFWETATAIAALNREQMRQQWGGKRRKPGGRKQGD